jgi:hypothetical protein
MAITGQKTRPASPSANSLSSVSSLAASIKSVFKKGSKSLSHPFKKIKTALASRASKSSNTISTDPGSVSNVTSPSGQASMSSIELVEPDPEKELSKLFTALFNHSRSHRHTEFLQRTWRSPIYSFFRPNVSVQHHNGRLCHFFPCAARKCKTELGGVRRFQDSKDKASTANLKKHAIGCFGAESVDQAINGNGAKPSGSIFSLFARQGQQPVRYSHRNHTNLEIQ